MDEVPSKRAFHNVCCGDDGSADERWVCGTFRAHVPIGPSRSGLAQKTPLSVVSFLSLTHTALFFIPIHSPLSATLDISQNTLN